MAHTLKPTDVEQLVASLHAAIQRVKSSPEKPGSAAYFLTDAEDPVDPVILRPVATPQQVQARSALETEAAALGTPPPSPPTLRGRLGGLAVRAIDRLIWWHSARLQRFGAALNAFLHTKSDEQDAVWARMNQIEAQLQDQKRQFNDASRRIDAIEQNATKSRFIGRMDAQFASVYTQFASVYRQTEADRKRMADLEHWAQVHAGRLFAATESLRAEIQTLRSNTGAGTERRADAGNTATVDDAFYAALQDRFRGSREEIKRRQERYLPILRDARVGTAEAPIVDLGCGRGEWLELIQSWGLHGFGIDSNAEMVRLCESRNLPVRPGDWFTHLSTMADCSAGAITSFHMIEHLPFSMLMALVNEARRVLKPGGLLVLETPNPANVMVGSNTFYLDPTHVKPIPKELLWFVLETRGFQQLRILELHPPAAFADIEGPAPLVERFSAPLDYVLIGARPE